ncbi:MAG: YdbH domain-containing protein [Magnetococcales bacterium]|nr:YdbH domain-containing protein [Magnetococcales bacterium]MBF0157531.1 YdbH domain-containing protein [Magnetococcales bacterium]
MFLLVLLGAGAGAWEWGWPFLRGRYFPEAEFGTVAIAQGRIRLHQPGWGTGIKARRLTLEPVRRDRPPFVGLASIEAEGVTVTLPLADDDPSRKVSRERESSLSPTGFEVPTLPFFLGKASCLDCRVVGRTTAGPFTVAGDLFLAMEPQSSNGGLSRVKLDAVLEIDLPLEQHLDHLVLSAEAEGSRLTLHHLAADLWGGEISLMDSWFDPNHREARLFLALNELDLAEILRPFAIPGLTVEARLKGQVALVVTRGEWSIPPAELAASGPGVVAYEDESWRQNAVAAGIPEILPEALRNFRFDTLALTLERPRQGDLRLVARMAGRNPDLHDGHPIEINLDLSGPLDEILRRGLEAREWVAKG